jgi:precorrin-6A/cobalt-precorrin-6A reductase
MRRVLVLAGTAEARELCARLAGRVEVLASLAGAVRRPLAQGVPTRVGGFGGAEGFLRVLAEEGIGAVVDATHPFAARISARTAEVCDGAGVPCLRLERAGWQAGPGDRWTWVADEAAAAGAVPEGARVFLATGRQTAGAFAGLAGEVWCRVIDAPEGAAPFARGGWLVGRPPFGVADEVALFRRLGIDVIVAKDSGAADAEAKLVAARELGLPVIMLRRPEVRLPAGGRVETVEAAVDWVERVMRG